MKLKLDTRFFWILAFILFRFLHSAISEEEQKFLLGPNYKIQETHHEVIKNINLNNGVDLELKSEPDLQASFQQNKLEIWNMWWSEWKDERCNESRSCLKDPRGEKVPLCYIGNRKYLENCGNHVNAFRACVGIESSSLDDCESLAKEEYHILLCRQKYTRRITTCSGSDSAFLCFPHSNTLFTIQPCRLKSRRICITSKGYLTKCRNLGSSEIVVSKESRRATIDHIFTQMRDWAEWWKEWVLDLKGMIKKEPDTEYLSLCKTKENSDDIELCKSNDTENAVCVSAKKGLVSECKNIRNAEIPVTICREKTSNKVITCGQYEPAFLCFSEVNNKTTMRPCKFENRQICLTDKHELKSCKHMPEKENSLYSKRSSSYGFIGYNTKPFTTIISSNNMHVCLDHDTKKLAICEKNHEYDYVCIDFKTGHLVQCKMLKNASKNNIEVCVSDSKLSLKICENSDDLNLCVSDSKMETLHICKNSTELACLYNGVIRDCRMTLVQHRLKKRGMQKETDFGNEEFVYEKERSFYRKLINNTRHLCQPKSAEFKFDYCNEDPNIQFLCLGMRSGKMEICNIYNATELILPVCVQLSDLKIVTCGKYSNANICSSSNDKEDNGNFTFQICTEENRYICLASEGNFINCNKKENETEQQNPASYHRIYHRNTMKNYKKIYNQQGNASAQRIKKEINHRQNGHKIENENDDTDYVLNEEELEESENADYNIRSFNYELKVSTGISTVKNKENLGIEDQTLKNEFAKTDSDDRTEDPPLETELSKVQLKKVEEKINAHTANSHLLNTNLCWNSDNLLENCDVHQRVHFACISAHDGRLTQCECGNTYQDIMPICKKVSSTNLMSCDIFSNLQLCFPKDEKTNHFLPCTTRSRFACLGNDGTPVKCKNETI